MMRAGREGGDRSGYWDRETSASGGGSRARIVLAGEEVFAPVRREGLYQRRTDSAAYSAGVVPAYNEGARRAEAGVCMSPERPERRSAVFVPVVVEGRREGVYMPDRGGAGHVRGGLRGASMGGDVLVHIADTIAGSPETPTQSNRSGGGSNGEAEPKQAVSW